MMREIKAENLQKAATKKQLWALFVASKAHGVKHDYRNDNLTMQQASELLQQFNAATPKVDLYAKAKKVAKETKDEKLEKEFIAYMTEKMQGVIATAKEALQIKSVLTDDPSVVKDPTKRKSYAFFGFGCGFTIIDFDKRSKVGKKIKELAGKHQMTTFLNMFLKAFTKDEIEYYKSVGSPLTALYYQDMSINGAYDGAVASFMEKKGVKNVFCRTYVD